MSAIANHIIGTRNGAQPFIEWVDAAKHRYYDSFNTERQLECVTRIARVEDKGDRELMLQLVDKTRCLGEQLLEAKKELATIHTVLVKLDKELDEGKE